MPADNYAVESRGLRLHVTRWRPARSSTLLGQVVLTHGFLEHGRAWDFVAEHLAQEGYCAHALDWRGHGDSQWVGAGGYYHFADYVADLTVVFRQLGEAAFLVGHSMGSNAALLYGGTCPESLLGLVAIEGLGPPDSDPGSAPLRYRAWLQDLARVLERPRHAVTLGEAEDRLRERFPSFPDPMVRHMAYHNTRETTDGKRSWKFDPLHQTRSPQPFYLTQGRAFWSEITCPVLYVEGAQSRLTLPDAEIEPRLQVLRANRVTIPNAGHHPHLETPEDLARILLDFFARCR